MTLRNGIRDQAERLESVAEALEIWPLGLRYRHDTVDVWSDEPRQREFVPTAASPDPWASLRDGHVRRTCASGDCVPNDLRVGVLRDDNGGACSPEPIGAKGAADVRPPTHVRMHCRNACFAELVGVPSANAKRGDEGFEAVASQAWREQRELALRAAHGKAGVDEKDPLRAHVAPCATHYA